MKRAVLGIVLVFAVQTAFAAVEYEFRQSTHSDLESTPSNEFTGRAVIDGDRSRVDFLSGNAYPPGTYLISTNGARTMTFVDPTRKSYIEVNAGSVTTALGTPKISIANRKVDLTMLDDHPIIAGLPTDHYRLTISYDITLALGSLSLTQAVRTLEDKFVTGAFGNVAETFLASGVLKTGNPEVDELIDIENSRVKGFALRQVINTTAARTSQQMPGSQLKISHTVTTTREIIITSISPKASVPAALFTVPAAFHKSDPLKDDTQKSPLHVLSMEPSGQ